MKNNRKKCVVVATMFIVISTIFAVALLPTVSSTEETLGTVSYQQTGYDWIEGKNVSLLFNHTDTGRPSSDLTVSFHYYTSFGDTRVNFTSNTISVDHTFVNDTKRYYYKDVNNVSNLYWIDIDFSSLQVPPDPDAGEIAMLRAWLDQKNSTIANLTTNKTGLWSGWNTSKGNELLYLTQRDSAILERDNAMTWNLSKDLEIAFLYSENENITVNYTKLSGFYADKVSQLSTQKWLKNEAYKTIGQMQNPWSMGYTWYEEQSNGEYIKRDSWYGNGSWLLIGMILACIPFAYITIKKTNITARLVNGIEDDDFDENKQTVIGKLLKSIVYLAYHKPKKGKEPVTVDEAIAEKEKEKFLVPLKTKKEELKDEKIPEFIPVPKEKEVKPVDISVVEKTVDKLLNERLKKEVDIGIAKRMAEMNAKEKV